MSVPDRLWAVLCWAFYEVEIGALEKEPITRFIHYPDIMELSISNTGRAAPSSTSEINLSH